MAKLSEKVHTDDEINTLIHQAHGQANIALADNHQEKYERFENLANALQHVVNERNDLRPKPKAEPAKAPRKRSTKKAGKKKSAKKSPKSFLKKPARKTSPKRAKRG